MTAFRNGWSKNSFHRHNFYLFSTKSIVFRQKIIKLKSAAFRGAHIPQIANETIKKVQSNFDQYDGIMKIKLCKSQQYKSLRLQRFTYIDNIKSKSDERKGLWFFWFTSHNRVEVSQWHWISKGNDEISTHNTCNHTAWNTSRCTIRFVLIYIILFKGFYSKS